MQAPPTSKICPKCKAHNPPFGKVCQCGHVFTTQFTQPGANPTVLGGAALQPPQPPQQPAPVQLPSAVQVQNSSTGLIHMVPGAHSAMAALLVSATPFTWFLAPIFNRQWFKFILLVLATFVLGWAFLIAMMFPFLRTVACIVFLVFVFDSTYNAIALEKGFPITQTTTMGGPWREYPDFQYLKAQMQPVLIGISAIYLVATISFDTYQVVSAVNASRATKAGEGLIDLGYGSPVKDLLDAWGEPVARYSDPKGEMWVYNRSGSRWDVVVSDGFIVSLSRHGSQRFGSGR